jgi:5-methylthioribose kinase
VKQARDRLAVAEDWPAPRERIFTECEAMEVLAPILPEGSVPRVQFVDRAIFAYGMEAVDDAFTLFKSLLLMGEWPERSFRACGELLGRFHLETARRGSLFQSRFASDGNFLALRIDPYFLRLKKSHGDLAAELDRVIEQALSGRRCLVHGDYSPKNIFMDPTGRRVVLLDYEVAHWGNPAFDAAFFMTHPIGKGVRRPEKAADYCHGIEDFIEAYWEISGPIGARAEEILPLWGAIALARVDGKSPLEYLNEPDQKEKMRVFGGGLLRGEQRTIESALGAFLAISK